MLAGHDSQCRSDIGAEFIDGARLAGVVAGSLDATAGEDRAGRLKPSHVVPLPAVHGDRKGRELLQRGVGIDA